VGVLTPPTAEAGVYYAGFALKLGDQPIQVLARIAVVK
jgi:hypothetical protein